ncbi:hypothetical protein ACFO25_13970 [Paenactinomyces guangxiensis]|uniref:Uncharacterized protein n=1 Tax=Paenactinomyces guangxiensis TaxID=1490290 RepID=A0A7W2A7W6_9BACL|nr:hypothetical protein [Paenactinomyces guangxiensis]MBA4493547.1 hypothetical protein [Paenactinomyces guangxiensis]MBH8590638.1 hypothetical protein [Paenactinomyces guangxiensis]
MTEREVLKDISKLYEELSSLKGRLTVVEESIRKMTQPQQTYQPTSVQEQLAQQMMLRSSQPDRSPQQYSGR